jgi:hypothetical protein
LLVDLEELEMVLKLVDGMFGARRKVARLVVNSWTAAMIAGLMLAGATSTTARAQPLSTALTYQGELAASGTPVNGVVDLRFRLFDAPAGGVQVGPTLCSDNITVAAGRFTVLMDFGAVFAGQKRYLEVDVRGDTGGNCADTTGYQTLGPRQELTAAPNAAFSLTSAVSTNASQLNGQAASFYTNANNLTSGTIPGGRLSGTLPNAMSLTNAGNQFTGNGAGLTALNATNVTTGTLSAARMPTNWAAGGDLTGFFPSPAIAPGSVTRSKLGADVEPLLGTVAPSWEQAAFAGRALFTAQPGRVRVAGNLAAVIDSLGDRVILVNVSTPSAPTVVGSIVPTGEPVDVAIAGNLAYVITSANRFEVHNISNPATPAFVGFTTTGAGPRVVAISGTTAFVGNNTAQTCQIINVANPAAPATLSAPGIGPVIDLAVLGDVVYVLTETETLVPILVSVPSSPVIGGPVLTEIQPRSLAVGAGRAYVVSAARPALEVFSLTSPVFPERIGIAPLPANPRFIAVNSTHAFVTTNRVDSSNVAIYELGTGVPQFVASPATSPTAVGVGALEDRMCVASAAAVQLEVFVPQAARRLNDYTSFGGGLNASDLVAGAIPDGRLVGTYSDPVMFASAGNYFVGDGRELGFLDASRLSFGVVPLARMPGLPASQVTSGTFADARLSTNVALRNQPNAFTDAGNSSFAGQLGVGVSAPAAKFHVRGNGTLGRMVIDPGAANGVAEIGLYENQTNSLGSIIRYDGTNTNQVQIIGVVSGPAELILATFDRDGAGSVNVPVAFSAASKAFRIDHPLDPANKELWHSCVESPDMMNVYNGNVVTGEDGYATVTLPDYFEALNRDFRYQLTVIDPDAPDVHFVRVSRQVEGNTFVIKSTPGNLAVSWQVTGVRQDPWAEQNRIRPVVEKAEADRGKLLQPGVVAGTPK